MIVPRRWILLGLVILTIGLLSFAVFKGLQIRDIHKFAQGRASGGQLDLYLDFGYIAERTLSSKIVVHGTIVDPDALVGVPQTDPTFPQGWRSARVRVNKTFAGPSQASEIFVVPMGWFPSVVVGNSFLEPFRKDQEFILFLSEHTELTQRCETMVWSHGGQDPIALTQPRSNKAEISSPISSRVD